MVVWGCNFSVKTILPLATSCSTQGEEISRIIQDTAADVSSFEGHKGN